MKIVITDFHNGWGGQPLQALLLATALYDAGHEVTLLAPPQSDLANKGVEAGVEVFTGCSFRRGFRPVTFGRDFFAFRRFVREHKVEIVHCHGSQDTWLAASVKLIGGGFRLIRTKHNSYPVKNHFFNRWLYGSLIDRTITVADSIRKDIVASGVASESRIVAIHAGLHDGFTNDVPDNSAKSVRAEFDIPQDAPVISLVGRLFRDKGQEVLMRAMPHILHKVSDAHVLLIGTGGDYDRQLELRKELGLDDRVHFTLFREDIARLTKAASVAVLAATACDASSTVLKEAMSLAVPVVGTDVGGTSEILDGGNCGIIVQPGDELSLAQAIVEIILDKTGEVKVRVERARERVGRLYTMSAVTCRTEEVYREALAG